MVRLVGCTVMKHGVSVPLFIKILGPRDDQQTARDTLDSLKGDM